MQLFGGSHIKDLIILFDIFFYAHEALVLQWFFRVLCFIYSPPIVLSWYSWNCPLTNLRTKLDFPTADSPSNTNLNWQIFPCVPFGLWAVPRFAMMTCGDNNYILRIALYRNAPRIHIKNTIVADLAPLCSSELRGNTKWKKKKKSEQRAKFMQTIRKQKKRKKEEKKSDSRTSGVSSTIPPRVPARLDIDKMEVTKCALTKATRMTPVLSSFPRVATRHVRSRLPLCRTTHWRCLCAPHNWICRTRICRDVRPSGVSVTHSKSNKLSRFREKKKKKKDEQ